MVDLIPAIDLQSLGFHFAEASPFLYRTIPLIAGKQAIKQRLRKASAAGACH